MIQTYMKIGEIDAHDRQRTIIICINATVSWNAIRPAVIELSRQNKLLSIPGLIFERAFLYT